MYILYDNGNSNNNAIILHVEEQKIILNETEFYLSDIKKRSDFKPYCKLVFPLKQVSIDKRTIKDSFGGSHYYPFALPPFDLFTYTAETKFIQQEISEITNQSYEVQFIFFPHHTNFKDAVLSLLKPTDPNVPFKVTTTDQNNNIIDYIPDRIFTESVSVIYPKSTLEIVETKQINGITYYTLEFTYKDIDGIFVSCDFDAYVKTSSGYVSHRKLKVKSGKVRFTYIPLGLNSDEKSEIQVGIGKYSDIVNILI